MNKQNKITELLTNFKPIVCVLGYISNEGLPSVCQMGYIYHEEHIVLHTNTNSGKWKSMTDGGIVSICSGFEHLEDRFKLRGKITKILKRDLRYQGFEDAYMQTHVDAYNYKTSDDGIIIIKPIALRYSKASMYDVEHIEIIIDTVGGTGYVTPTFL